MKIIQAILAWNLLSKLHASDDIETAKYIVNARKTLRPVINSYAEFEKDARATSPEQCEKLIRDEQQREAEVKMPPLTDDTLAAIIAANTGIAAGEFDILSGE